MGHFHFRVVIVLGALLFASVHADAQINETLKLTASDAAGGDEFGFSVALSGTTTIVGANRDDDAGFNSGSAYVFDTTTGSQLFKLTALDASAGDFFGQSVAVGTAEEKQNRVVEVALSRVKPAQALVGKALGIGAPGLTQPPVLPATAAAAVEITGRAAVSLPTRRICIPNRSRCP